MMTGFRTAGLHRFEGQVFRTSESALSKGTGFSPAGASSKSAYTAAPATRADGKIPIDAATAEKIKTLKMLHFAESDIKILLFKSKRNYILSNSGVNRI
jgi:hypothetical protein